MTCGRRLSAPARGKATDRSPRRPMPTRSGSPTKENYEYVPDGTAGFFMAFEPRAGGTESRCPSGIPGTSSPDCLSGSPCHSESDRAAVVVDNISAHRPGVLYGSQGASVKPPPPTPIQIGAWSLSLTNTRLAGPPSSQRSGSTPGPCAPLVNPRSGRPVSAPRCSGQPPRRLRAPAGARRREVCSTSHRTARGGLETAQVELSGVRWSRRSPGPEQARVLSYSVMRALIKSYMWDREER